MLGSPGSKPWTTSKPALLEREAQVRADTDGDAEARAARHGNGGADRDRVGALAARERATPRRQVGRPARRERAR